MLKADKYQKQRIAILVKGDTELKARLVQEATGDVTKTSTNDLSHVEANRILQHFGQKPVIYDNWAFFDPNKKSHKQILSLCIQYGWSVPHKVHGEVADLGELSEWLKNDPKCTVHKKLKDMTPNEVSSIIFALENMVDWKYKKRTK